MNELYKAVIIMVTNNLHITVFIEHDPSTTCPIKLVEYMVGEFLPRLPVVEDLAKDGWELFTPEGSWASSSEV